MLPLPLPLFNTASISRTNYNSNNFLLVFFIDVEGREEKKNEQYRYNTQKLNIKARKSKEIKKNEQVHGSLTCFHPTPTHVVELSAAIALPTRKEGR